MKTSKKYFGWSFGLFTAMILSTGVVWAADGDPDANQKVRDASAIAKLKELKDVSLIYVKGMT